MSTYFYEMLFPDVSFRDKICVVFSDGSTEVYKHLYMNSFILKEIEWENVVNCYEVQESSYVWRIVDLSVAFAQSVIY